MIKTEFSPTLRDINFPLEQEQQYFDEFLNIVNSPDYGFVSMLGRKDLAQNTISTFNQYFKNREHMVHVGIGGSSLGPEMLVKALGKKNTDSITFLNNIDPDDIHEKLSSINLKNSFFYIVSKSGSTAETMAVFAIICNELNKLGITKEDYKEYFVFATDPDKSQLLEISKELGIPTLEIPSNVGGRFSVLSPVGLLPAVYTGIDIESLINGASEFCNKLSSECSSENELSLSAHLLEHLRSQGISQTVLMPYSSKLRSFSDWFVQLWAESLGKENCRDGKTVNTGLTPISSYGATDQHSQVQLFMEGPKDKFIAFVSIDNFQTDFELKNDFSQPSLTKLSTHSLAELMRAELIGTKEALDQKGRPYLELKLAQLDEASLGALIGFFECLTVLMGIKMNINPFDQPGVEAGKIFAFEWLGRKNK